MKKECRGYREWFAEALYGELPEGRAREFQAHLDACGECREEFARMRATLQVMDRREIADPGAVYWDSFWDRLEEKLPPVQGEGANVVKLAPASRSGWLYRSVAAAAILLLGIFIGKTFFSPAIDPGVIPGLQQGVGFGGREEGDAGNGRLRGGHDMVQQCLPMVNHALDGGSIEQIGVVLEHARQLGFYFSHCQRYVKLGCLLHQFNRGEPQIIHLEGNIGNAQRKACQVVVFG